MVKGRVNRRRQEKEEEELQLVPNWSELHVDLLQVVFKRLSFISLNRAKLVCSSWYSASRGCIPNQNQIPWLISFPPNSSSCVFFVPDDKETVYRSREFGVDFAGSYCLASCGNWLLLLNDIYDLYILNLLTGERFDLPVACSVSRRSNLKYAKACFWIDNKTKDYLVVSNFDKKFIKKGYSNWENLPVDECVAFFYSDKNQELYFYDVYCITNILVWDFSGDKPRKDRTVSLPPRFLVSTQSPFFNNVELSEGSVTSYYYHRMAVTVYGEFLNVVYTVIQNQGGYFRIYKINQVDNEWVQIDSLGDEALMYDMGITVVANDSIPGIKKNSIYFSDRHDKPMDYANDSNIFVYDLTTHQKEFLPQCVIGNISFTKARWFFPC